MTRSTPSSLRKLSTGLLAFLCVAGAAAPALAQRDRFDRFESGEHEGLYFALGAGPALQLLGGEDGAFGVQGELRFGYSFARTFQIYLAGHVGEGSHPVVANGTVLNSDVLVGIRYFLFANPRVGVYGRAAIGVGIVSAPDIATDYGIAEDYALGMEFRLGPGAGWSISPELFYRRTNETSVYRVDMLGLGILMNFN